MRVPSRQRGPLVGLLRTLSRGNDVELEHDATGDLVVRVADGTGRSWRITGRGATTLEPTPAREDAA